MKLYRHEQAAWDRFAAAALHLLEGGSAEDAAAVADDMILARRKRQWMPNYPQIRMEGPREREL